uniref:Cytochrome c biogenesis FN n=1 Tax=Taxus cuspidata TaxID=99806 RepID=A0A6M4RLG0_TAXCU|nr:cytochrome c biogenesis FN [Taxus cuspidata]
MSVNELCHYLLLLGLFVAFAYDRKQPPAFGASLHFLCTLLSLLGLSFRHTSSNSPNYNVFTNSNANAPLPYQIPGTWSNHEGSIPLRCRIPSFYGFLFRYRVQPHNVSERGRETAFCSFVLSLYRAPGAEPYIYTFFEQARTPAPHPGRNRALNRLSALLDPPIYRVGPIYREGGGRQGPLLDRGGSGGSRALSGKKATFLLHLARDAEERAEQRPLSIYGGAVGIALFFPLSPLASSNPFVRNSFVCTESLAELNPVLQDPVLAIHPPCIYAGDVASAMGFGLCIYKMMNGIVALYSPMQKEGNGALCSAGCVGAPFVLYRLGAHPTQSQSIGGGVVECSARPRPPLYIYGGHSCTRPPLDIWGRGKLSRVGTLYRDMAGERDYRHIACAPRYRYMATPIGITLLHMGGGGRGTRPPQILSMAPRYRYSRWGWGGRGTLCRTAGVNTVVSDPRKDRERIRIWILTCWWFFTVGILLGSWWAHHELGWGGRWFRDPVENASPMPWVLATACIHSVILPKVYLWTLFPNIVTFSRRVSGTFLVRSGLPASVHSPATDSTRGIFLWRFFLLITGISLILFFQIRGHRSIERALFSKPLMVRRSFMRSYG